MQHKQNCLKTNFEVMAKSSEVAIEDTTGNVDVNFGDDVKTENVQIGRLSITDEPLTSQSTIYSNLDEKASDIDVGRIPSPEIGTKENIETSDSKVHREEFSKYPCPIFADMDKKAYLNRKHFSPVRRPYKTLWKDNHLTIPDIYGGDYSFFRKKNAIPLSRKKDTITPNVSRTECPSSLDLKVDRKHPAKIQIEDDCSSYILPLDNDDKNKDAVSIISTESGATVSTLKNVFAISSKKDRPPVCVVESGDIRTHWRTTGFYRNCAQTFITKHAHLKRKNWANTGFVVAGLYVFGFLCLGSAVFNSAPINLIIIVLGVVLVSLASGILYLVYAVEKNRSLYTLSSGERRKVTFSNPFPSVR